MQPLIPPVASPWVELRARLPWRRRRGVRLAMTAAWGLVFLTVMGGAATAFGSAAWWAVKRLWRMSMHAPAESPSFDPLHMSAVDLFHALPPAIALGLCTMIAGMVLRSLFLRWGEAVVRRSVDRWVRQTRPTVAKLAVLASTTEPLHLADEPRGLWGLNQAEIVAAQAHLRRRLDEHYPGWDGRWPDIPGLRAGLSPPFLETPP